MAGGRPVKMFLDRVQEHLAAGNRPSATAHIKMGANRDGTIVAMIADAHGTGGVGGSGNRTLPYCYSIADTAVTQSAVRTNFGNQRAMRAPGHPQSCALTEAAMDDLADKLGMDPIEFRLKNLNPTDFRTPTYEAELAMGAELIGWKEKRKPRGRSGTGPDQARDGRGDPQLGRRPGGAGQESRVHRSTPTGRSRCNRRPRTWARAFARCWRSLRPSSGAQADRYHLEHRQLALSAGPGFGRLDDDADHVAAGL